MGRMHSHDEDHAHSLGGGEERFITLKAVRRCLWQRRPILATLFLLSGFAVVLPPDTVSSHSVPISDTQSGITIMPANHSQQPTAAGEALSISPTKPDQSRAASQEALVAEPAVDIPPPVEQSVTTKLRAAALEGGRSTVKALGSSASPANLGFLVAVLSARDNFSRRKFIRGDWTKEFMTDSQEQHSGSALSKVVFVVGDRGTSGEESAIQDQLMKEQRQFGDILLVDAEDFYENSAKKMVAFYRLLHQLKLTFVSLLKMDDDTVMLLGRFFQTLHPGPCVHFYLGTCTTPSRSPILDALESKDKLVWWGSMRIREQAAREEGSKWAVKWEDFQVRTSSRVSRLRVCFAILFWLSHFS